MGSGSRARSRGFNPKDNFHVEESHRVSGSPPREISLVRRLDISDGKGTGWCRACSASTSGPSSVHLPGVNALDSNAVGVSIESHVSHETVACRACGNGGGLTGSPPSTSPPSPLAKSAEYLLERYAERRALSARAQTSQGGDGRGVRIVQGNHGKCTDEAPVGSVGSGTETSAETAKRKEKVCDACVSCGDMCGISGCSVCGGPKETEIARALDVERGEEQAEGVSLEAATAAAKAAAQAAANPRRDGWGHDAGVFAMDDDDVSTSSGSTGARKTKHFTCCEVRRKRANGDALLVANGFVYDATLFLEDHPVGPLPILRSIDRDNTEDLTMHSHAAQRAWHKLRVGVLKSCPTKGFGDFKPPKGDNYARCVVQ